MPQIEFTILLPNREGVGHEGIRVYESMILTQHNSKGNVELLGVADKYGVYRWFIEYDVLPKNLWASKLPQIIIDSPEWESYRTIDFSPTGNRIAQAGISTVEFNDEGLVTPGSPKLAHQNFTLSNISNRGLVP